MCKNYKNFNSSSELMSCFEYSYFAREQYKNYKLFCTINTEQKR